MTSLRALDVSENALVFLPVELEATQNMAVFFVNLAVLSLNLAVLFEAVLCVPRCGKATSLKSDSDKICDPPLED